MAYDPKIHHRRSIRLQTYDYSRSGAYFVTICVQGKACLFGDVVDGTMRLNDAGGIVARTWEWLPTRNAHVELDAWVVMPNHVHGIIVLTGDGWGELDGGGRGGSGKGGSRTAPTDTRKSLGRLVGMFKTVSTKQMNILRGTPGATVWQRNYWEHIVRDESELDRIREYIVNNPGKWEMDQLHPGWELRETPAPYGDGDSRRVDVMDWMV